ncbi:MAG: hypothetical protein HGB12_14065 [Bacteroidetes bacterium]|nr:hypothetical protein [Bacteroidota bacterium]
MRTLEKINHRIIKRINTTDSIDSQMETMYYNLWRQYGYKPNKNKMFSYDVVFHKWSEQARIEFYSIESHKKLIKQMGFWKFAIFDLCAGPTQITIKE